MDYFQTGTSLPGKPRVLFSVRRHNGVRLDGGEWVWKTVFVGPFEAAGVGCADVFFNDEAYHALGPDGLDEAFLTICRQGGYDAVFHYWMPNWLQWHLNLKPLTLYRLRSELGLPIFSIWLDTWCESFAAQYKAMLPFYDLTVVTDTLECVRDTPGLETRCLNLCPPPDTRVFTDPGHPRDIDLCFCGTRGIGSRAAYLDAVASSGLPLREIGGYNGHPLSLDAYAGVLQRARISLNFSETMGGRRTLKGRVMETALCGALLLEEANAETSRYFTPYEEYVPFDNAAELIERARYYLAHPDDAARIAANGRRRARELARPEAFWGRIMTTLAGVRRADTEAARRALDSLPAFFQSLRPRVVRLDEADAVLRGKRTVIWGTGAMYRERVAPWLRGALDDIVFLGFADNDARTWGRHVDGFPVHAPDSLARLGVQAVVLATWAAEGIINELHTKGLLLTYVMVGDARGLG